ncbi:MAG: tetratricopeptide repeat protein, partial [Cyanobacteria bacterium HKST-UBA02]|nr:tetratricopeptide repeat protein [Cyanobacteria bacterium HKST-UBA02]
LFQLKKNDEALAKWKRAIELDPGFASAYYNIGQLLESEKKLDESLKYYARAIAIDPRMADAYYCAGSLLKQNEHLAPARVLLERGIALEPGGKFVRHARKQISDIDKVLTSQREEESKQGNTASGVSSGGDKSESGLRTARRQEPSTKSRDKKDGGGLKKLFGNKLKIKKENGKEVDMFIQPPSSAEDLQAKPSETN